MHDRADTRTYIWYGAQKNFATITHRHAHTQTHAPTHIYVQCRKNFAP